MTVRHALDILEDEGLIDRRRGRSGGTYVRTVPPTLSLTKKDSIATQLRERGHEITVRVVSVNKTHVPKHVAAALGVNDATYAWDSKRLFIVDGPSSSRATPSQWTWLPSSISTTCASPS